MMGRTLALGDFGQLSAILAVQGIFSILPGGMILLYARHAAALRARGDHGALRTLYDRSLKEGAAAALAATVAVAATTPWWSRWMHIESAGAALLTALLIAAFFVQAPPLAFVRGLQRFWLFAAGLGGAGILKVALAAAVIAAGINTVSNAVVTLIVSTLLSAAVLHVALLRGMADGAPAAHGLSRGETAAFLLSAMAGSVFPMIYLNADMILIRAVMTDEVSGHYGAFMVMGKMVLQLGQVVGIALFPAVVAGAAAGGGLSPAIAFRGFGLVLGAGFFAVAGAFLFPEFLLRLMLKTSDPALAPFLGWYTLAAVAVALLFVESNYSLARHRYGYLIPGALAAAAQVAGIIRFSGSLEAIVKFQAALFWGVFLIRAALLLREVKAIQPASEGA
ncbi:MAG: hypothetical protein HZA03_06085 [Nitrospinae bacterium]|nr:hypothetical protein [Nitrospinota bacterium]